MRVNEVITPVTEFISQGQHAEAYEQAVKGVVPLTLKYLAGKGHEFIIVKDAVNSKGSLTPLLKLCKDYFISDFQQRAAHFLGEEGRKYSDNMLHKVVFQRLENAGGHAEGTKIVINDIIFDEYWKLASETMLQYTIDRLEDEEYLYSTFFQTLHEKDLVEELQDGYEFQKFYERLASVMVHEMVHVIQHGKQFVKGRSETEYRSYLDNPKWKRKNNKKIGKGAPGEFWDRHSDGQTGGRWDILYKASPQEIAAFSQQEAVKLVKDWGYLERGTDLSQPIPKAEMLATVPEYVRKHFAHIPRNPVEQKVYNRYAKLIYQETERILNSLLEKQKAYLAQHAQRRDDY